MSKKRRLKKITHERGKGDFVLRKTSEGLIEKVCLCEWNADVSEKGCISQVPGDLIEEVVRNDGTYLPGNFDLYLSQKRLGKRCFYCYNLRKNSGGCRSKIVDLRTQVDIREKKIKEVRLGKSTEVGHLYYFHTLMDLFKLYLLEDVAVIFPTKMFPFGVQGVEQAVKTPGNTSGDFLIRYAAEIGLPTGEELSEFLNKLKLSLNYSTGHDRMEPGVVSQGYSNSWRIMQALQFHAQKVNTSLYVLAEVTQSIKGNVDRGFSIKEALKAREKYGINMRLVPLRMNSNLVARIATGLTIGQLKNSGYHKTLDMFDPNHGDSRRRYRTRKDDGIGQDAIPDYLHPDFQKLFDEGVGICGQVGDTEYCDKCNICPRNPQRISFPRSEVPRIKYNGVKKPTARELLLRKHPKLIHVPGKYGPQVRRHLIELPEKPQP